MNLTATYDTTWQRTYDVSWQRTPDVTWQRTYDTTWQRNELLNIIQVLFFNSFRRTSSIFCFPTVD